MKRESEKAHDFNNKYLLAMVYYLQGQRGAPNVSLCSANPWKHEWDSTVIQIVVIIVSNFPREGLGQK